MKRNKKLIALSHDHHHGLRLAQHIKKDAPENKVLPNDVDGKVNYTLKSWNEELKIHFRNEEKILFPAVRGRDEIIDNLIAEVMIEHKEIERLIGQLNQPGYHIDTLDTLGYLLEHHIRKEERELFDKIQKVFGEDELNRLVDEIEPVKNN